MDDLGYIILSGIQNSKEARQFIALKRLQLFSRMHEIVFYGKGGYSFEAVYTMPTWLRNYIHSELLKFYKQESEAVEKASSSSSSSTVAPAVARPPSPAAVPRKADMTSSRKVRN